MADINEKVLKQGFKQGIRIVQAVLQKSLMDAADELLRRVAFNRGYSGFTGNTQLSYACGVYIDGKLVHVSFQENWNGPTRRMKVRKGKVVYLEQPFEGEPRAVKGMVDIVENHGPYMSLKQLENYRAPRNCVAMMMTTGTEYSTWLEQEAGFDVLGRTKNEAEKILNANWKVIDDKFWEDEAPKILG